MSAPTTRLAVVLSHPVQYYSPWFRWLANHGWTLRVFYLWDAGVTRRTDPGFGRELVWDVDLLSGYEHEFVPNRAQRPATDRFGGLDNPDLPARIASWAPDAVLVFGYKFITHLRLICRCDTPLIFRGDSHLLDGESTSLPKRWCLALVYARFAAITYVGRANLDYFLAFGAQRNRLFHAPHCVDATLFTSNERTRAEAAALKASLGLTNERIVLFAGKLIPKKQPRELLLAFLASAPARTALVFVGEGSEKEELQAIAAAHPRSTVRFLPFANQTEMPVRYLLADVFALPSRGPGETWGLAVNEAMHSGVPCLVSDRVGCQRDLVTEGETGWVFSAESTSSLQAALARAVGDVARDREGFRTRVLQRISSFDYAHAAEGLAHALDCACAVPRPI